jgi:2-polyprenyl-6-hydroxyphenyl methylase/3-demethylubiquinone-9 3-methyltransferase
VRGAFGRYEPQIAEAWRSIFVDLDRCADLIYAWVPNAARILEVGCGEGALTERLASRFRTADILGIDVTPRVGRLFRGPTAQVTFLQVGVEAVARERPGAFDLIVLSDVLHHVPVAVRHSLLSGVADALAPQGAFVFKEWLRTGSPIHWLCYAADRFITGDQVSYIDAAEARYLLDTHLTAAAVVAQAGIPPWTNNQAFLVRRTGAGAAYPLACKADAAPGR